MLAAWAFVWLRRGGRLSVAACGLLVAVAPLVGEHRFWGARLEQQPLPGSRALALQLWCTGVVAPQHVGSSWTSAGRVSSPQAPGTSPEPPAVSCSSAPTCKAASLPARAGAGERASSPDGRRLTALTCCQHTSRSWLPLGVVRCPEIAV